MCVEQGSRFAPHLTLTPSKKLYGRTLRVAVFFCLLHSPFAQPPLRVTTHLGTQNNKNSLQRKPIKRKKLSNQHTKTSSGTQSRALRMQQCYASLPQQCTAAARWMAPSMTCTLVAFIYLLCTVDVPPALGRNARVCCHLRHQQTMHKAPSPRSLGRPTYSQPLLLHTTPLIRMKLAYNAYPASARSYQNNKITHKKAHQLCN